jgi:hypothetical protein
MISQINFINLAAARYVRIQFVIFYLALGLVLTGRIRNNLEGRIRIPVHNNDNKTLIEDGVLCCNF